MGSAEGPGIWGMEQRIPEKDLFACFAAGGGQLGEL